MLSQLILCGAYQPGVFYVYCSTAAYWIYPGCFLITLAVSKVIPMFTLVAYDRSDDLSAFLWSSLITFVCGLVLIFAGVQRLPNFVHEICTC